MYLHAIEAGPADAPEIVFCHGLFGQGKNFGSIARALAPEFHSVMLDMPNHGRSDWTDVVSYDAMAEEVAGWLRQRGSGPHTLIGHSMGGKIVMLIALRHPELVKRLVVVDMSPGVSQNATSQAPLMEAMQALDLDNLGSRSEADQLLAPGIPDETVRHFLMQNLRHENVGGNQDWGEGHKRWHWMMNLAALSEQREAVAAWPDVRGTYDGPVLWIAGSESTYITDADSAPMQALFPKVRKVTLKGAGHWVHSEQPEAFTQTLRMFLEATAEA